MSLSLIMDLLIGSESVSCKALEVQDEIEGVFKRSFEKGGEGGFVEGGEEVRLISVNLACELARARAKRGGGEGEGSCGSSGNVKEEWDGIVGVLPRALTDDYPEVKRSCCVLLSVLCKSEGSSSAVRMSAGELLPPLLLNLSHQHGKTRRMTVKGIACVLTAGGGWKVDDKGEGGLVRRSVLPCLKRLAFDGVASVRKALASSCGKILRQVVEDVSETSKHGCEGGCKEVNEDDSPVVDAEVELSAKREGSSGAAEARSSGGLEFVFVEILTLLLYVVSDEVNDVGEEARTELESIAALHQGEGSGSENDERSVGRFIGHFFPELVKPLVEESTHWTTLQSVKSLRTLTVVISCIGEHSMGCPLELVRDLNSNLEMLLSAFATSARDDEEEVRISAECSAQCLGRALSNDASAVNILLRRIDGSVSGMGTPEKIQGSLSVLKSVLKSASQRVVLDHSKEISRALSSSHILQMDDRDVLESLLSTCEEFVYRLRESAAFDLHELSHSLPPPPPPRGSSKPSASPTTRPPSGVILDLLKCCIFLMGADVNYDLRDQTLSLLDTLSSINPDAPRVRNNDDDPDLPSLLDFHFVKLVEALKDGKEAPIVWEGSNNPMLQAFDALMRLSGAVAGKYFHEVFDIFESHLTVDTEPESRLVVMVLLESILEDKEVAKCVKKFSEKLIKDIVAPNIIWRAGGVASTIRKVSIACLFTLLKAETLETKVLFYAAPALLPILKTNLGDYDASSRQLCCLILGILFAALPGALGSEPVHQLYPELLKCLDDSSDDVRFVLKAPAGIFLFFFCC